MRTYRAPQKSVLFLFLSTRQKGWKRLKSMRLSRGVRSPRGFSCLVRVRVTFSNMVIVSVGERKQESNQVGDQDMVRLLQREIIQLLVGGWVVHLKDSWILRMSELKGTIL